MPRNESGQYVKPPGTTAIPNTTITSAPYNALQDDMADALTESLPRTGVAPMLADLPMNGYKITGLEDGADAGDAVNFGQLDAKLDKDGSNVDDGSTFRANTDTDYTFHDVDIGDLSSGVLTISREGTYFKLTGHGSADFSIEEFGDERPVGKAFYLLVPRTIADTGGTVNALGNKVSFIHSASGAGLDMTIARRNAGSGTFLYTYEAYPDACNLNGDAINLYELLMFVPVGSGRHECRKLPEDIEFRLGNAFVRRSALGMQEISRRGDFTMPSSGIATWTLPASFASDDYSYAASSSSSSTNSAIAIHAPAQTTGSISFRAMSSSGTQVQTNTRPILIGIWKI